MITEVKDRASLWEAVDELEQSGALVVVTKHLSFVDAIYGHGAKALFLAHLKDVFDVRMRTRAGFIQGLHGAFSLTMNPQFAIYMGLKHYRNLLLWIPRGGILPTLSPLATVPLWAYNCKRDTHTEPGFVSLYHRGEVPSLDNSLGVTSSKEGIGFGIYDFCCATGISLIAPIIAGIKRRGIAPSDYDKIEIITMQMTPDAAVILSKLFPGIKILTVTLMGCLKPNWYIDVSEEELEWVLRGCEEERPIKGIAYLSVPGDAGDMISGITLEDNTQVVLPETEGIRCEPRIVKDADHVILTSLGELKEVRFVGQGNMPSVIGNLHLTR